MPWQDYITESETIILPWTGGRLLHSNNRVWSCQEIPKEVGWYSWTEMGRKVRNPLEADPRPDLLGHIRSGFLVGDQMVFDGKKTPERVFFVDTSLPKFTRASGGKIFPEGPWIFHQQEMPLGVEEEVMMAFEDGLSSLDHIPHVTPALAAAFRIEVEYKALRQRRAEERAERLRLEALRQEIEQRAVEMRRMLGDGASRRLVAQVDFETAARAALREGNAELLSVRKTGEEYIVRYRVDLRRLECICDAQMRIVDAGVCLTDEATGIKDDSLFTLESLPSVIREADEMGVLVVWRHG